jgi:hypothetical protein
LIYLHHVHSFLINLHQVHSFLDIPSSGTFISGYTFIGYIHFWIYLHQVHSKPKYSISD